MTNLTTPQRKESHSFKIFYLTLSVLSLVVSWSIFLQFLLSGEASINTFFQQAFATPIATLFSSDVLISALIFFFFTYLELKRLGMPINRLAIYIVTTFSVGVCFALSLFLYHREIWLEHTQVQAK